jgi:hypothetical protein
MSWQHEILKTSTRRALAMAHAAVDDFREDRIIEATEMVELALAVAQRFLRRAATPLDESGELRALVEALRTVHAVLGWSRAEA